MKMKNIGVIALFTVLIGCSSEDAPKSKEQILEEQRIENIQKLKKLTEPVHLSVSDNISLERVEAVAKALKKIDDDIVESQFFNNDMVNIRLKAYNSNDFLTVVHTAESAYKVIEALKKSNIKDLKQFNISQNVTLVDKYNNKNDSELYTINYNYPELMKFNTDGSTTYFDYLKFANYSSNNSMGTETFLKFCADGATFTGDFCKSI